MASARPEGAAGPSETHEDRIGRWVAPAIRQLAAYPVPEARGFMKLDAMENPYPWPEELVEEWLPLVREVRLNRYPDAEAQSLKARLREFMGIPSELGLLLGNGSDELIQMLALTLGGMGRSVLSPEPTFSMYRIIAAITGSRYIGVPVRADDFSLDADAMVAAIRQHEPALVVLGYPNNPTGNLFDRAAMQRIIEASPGLVLVDEAYFNFAGASFLNEVSSYEHVLLLRTLSKLGLAGLRLGMLTGPRAWLDQVNKVRLPYNINTLSQVSGAFMLAHAGVLTAQAERICRDRDALYRELNAIEGVEVWPSRTNFLLLRVAGRATELWERLKRRKILIKNLDGTHPLLACCLRVTVGTAEENRGFTEAVRELLSDS